MTARVTQEFQTENMFTELNDFLNFDSHTNAPCGLIGISEKGADCAFLFHHFISFLLRASSDGVCLLSFTQSYNHFNSVGNKIGSNLTAATKQGRLLFIDGLRLLGSAANFDTSHGDKINMLDSSGGIDIKILFKIITDHIEKMKKDSGKYPSVIIDNISVLVYLGCSVTDIIFFVHYLRSFYLDSQESMIVVGVNNDVGDEDEENMELWKYIQHCSSLHLVVSGLDTGYCKEVHGQVCNVS